MRSKLGFKAPVSIPHPDGRKQCRFCGAEDIPLMVQARYQRKVGEEWVYYAKENLHRHHPDYSKPKEVIVLCGIHHKAVHRTDAARVAETCR